MDFSSVMMFLAVSGAAFVAAAINAVAGGGTFLTFPTLTGVAGLSEKVANMTSTLGLWAGSASSVVTAWKDIKALPRRQVVVYSIISLVGGTVGSILLVKTNRDTFKLIIPWLLLFATIVFCFGKPIARWAGHKHGERSLKWMTLVAGLQVLIAIYGGYFGAGIGVLMLAGLSFAGLETVHQMNALKVWLGTIINGVAIVVFIAQPLVTGSEDRINWGLAGAMVVAATAGGLFGMRVARRLPAAALRGVILVVGAGLTAWYFWKAYG